MKRRENASLSHRQDSLRFVGVDEEVLRLFIFVVVWQDMVLASSVGNIFSELL